MSQTTKLEVDYTSESPLGESKVVLFLRLRDDTKIVEFTPDSNMNIEKAQSNGLYITVEGLPETYLFKFENEDRRDEILEKIIEEKRYS